VCKSRSLAPKRSLPLILNTIFFLVFFVGARTQRCFGATVKLMSNCGGFMAKVLNSRTVLVFHMATSTIVQVPQDLLDAIFEGAKRLYPKETFMLLRGKKSKDTIRVSDLVVPPLAVYGYGFANLPFHMLPMDFSVVGTVHSHPSGNINPSSVDLNHFFGRVLMIVGFPFASAQNVAVYDSKGERLPFQVTEE
jgi:proteasome lid subunit RPN8/RPN11